MEQHCRDGSTHHDGNSEVESFEIAEFDEDEYELWHDPYTWDRCYWSFAFTHASTSSKCILFAIRCLFQLNDFVEQPEQAECIVSEMIDWLKVRDPALNKKYSGILTIGKNQTADPQPQDQLIAWIEDAHNKIEEVKATENQWYIDENLRRSAEWADVIQRSQTA